MEDTANRESSYTVEQLFRKTVEILSNFGRSHTIMQGFAHQCEHIMEVTWKVLLRPVPLPALRQTKEQVNGVQRTG